MIERKALFPVRLHASTAGSTVKDLRTLQDYTQVKMAAALQTNTRTLRRFETNEVPIPHDRFMRYCHELGLRVVLIDWDLPEQEASGLIRPEPVIIT